MHKFNVNFVTSLYVVVVSLMEDSSLSSIDQASSLFTPDKRDPRTAVLYFSPEGNMDKLYSFLSFLDKMDNVYVKSFGHYSDSLVFGYVEGSENSDK